MEIAELDAKTGLAEPPIKSALQMGISGIVAPLGPADFPPNGAIPREVSAMKTSKLGAPANGVITMATSKLGAPALSF